MNRRIIGGGISLASLLTAYYFSDSLNGKLPVVLFSALFGITLFQTIWNFDRFGSVSARFDKSTTPVAQRMLTGITLVVPFFAVMLWLLDRYDAAAVAELSKNGVVTEAIVTDGWSSKRRKGGTTYTLKLKFKDQNGSELEVEEPVSGSEFQKVSIGMPVEIIYKPGDSDLLDVLIDQETRSLYGK